MATEYNASYPFTIDANTASVTSSIYSVASTETVLKRDFLNIWLRKTPLLAIIKNGKAGWQKAGTKKGNMMLWPIMIAKSGTVYDGVTAANELTPITPYANDGLTQAAYLISHYRGAVYFKASEDELINNQRGNYKDAILKQKMAEATDVLADDIGGTTADAEDKVMGFQFPLITTSNTVGGISQTTYTDWAPNLTSSAGAFDLDLIDDLYDAGQARGAKFDHAVFSYHANNNVWGNFRSALAPAQRLVNTKFKAEYGFTNIEYLDMICMQDNRIGSATTSSTGKFFLLDSSTWFFAGDESPKVHHKMALSGTDAEEIVLNQFSSIGCGAPCFNAACTGILA